jgi:hypothetical protein
MEDLQRDVAEGNEFSFLYGTVRRRRILNLRPPYPPMGSLVHNQGGIGTMDDQLSSRHFLEPLIFAGMVKVAMGVDNIDTPQVVFGQCH